MAPQGRAQEVSARVHERLAESSPWPVAVLSGASDAITCLENPRDGGAWWAAIYGVTQSWTRLKRLSSSMSTLLIF